MARLRRDPDTEPSYVRMKEAAVRREGREEEFDAHLRAVAAEFPEESRAKRKGRAFDLMGLDNVTALIRWRDQEAVAIESAAELEGEREEAARDVAEIRAEFEEVFRSLPREADRPGGFDVGGGSSGDGIGSAGERGWLGGVDGG